MRVQNLNFISALHQQRFAEAVPRSIRLAVLGVRVPGALIHLLSCGGTVGLCIQLLRVSAAVLCLRVSVRVGRRVFRI